MKKSQIIKEANRVLNIELNSSKTLKSTFNNSFCKGIETIFKIKGRVIVTGIGKSGHIANKISATLSYEPSTVQGLWLPAKWIKIG